MSTTTPVTMVPGLNLIRASLCSNSSAKLSVMLIPEWKKAAVRAALALSLHEPACLLGRPCGHH
jgi:hypothetical protein